MRNRWFFLYAAVGVVVLLVLYKTYDPMSYGFYPRCIIHQTTGLQCSGCGSQRAIHALLNLNVAEAWHHNQMVVLFVPYVLFGAVISIGDIRDSKVAKALYGRVAILIILAVMVVFTIVRNVI